MVDWCINHCITSGPFTVNSDVAFVCHFAALGLHLSRALQCGTREPAGSLEYYDGRHYKTNETATARHSFLLGTLCFIFNSPSSFDSALWRGVHHAVMERLHSEKFLWGIRMFHICSCENCAPYCRLIMTFAVFAYICIRFWRWVDFTTLAHSNKEFFPSTVQTFFFERRCFISWHT